MSRRLRRLQDERGIALVMALAFTVALSMLVFGMTTYVTSNQKSAANSSDDQVARGYAEAALNAAYSRIVYANNTTGMNPASPNLLGCAAANDLLGESDCSSASPLCVAITGTCPSGTYSATVGTASVTGFYTGTVSGSYGGLSQSAGWWLIVATGYARNSSGQLDGKTVRGMVQIQAMDQGAVASVWNHVFLTAPKVSGVCQTTFSGNTTVLDMPIYTIGNLCFTGNGDGLHEVTGGQAVDLQVGGVLYYGGNGDFVGDSSSAPITSGVVVDGCATTAAQLSAQKGTTCSNGSSPQYYVSRTGTYVSQSDPELKDSQVESDYTNFDPGPRNPCMSSTSPAGLTLQQLDNTISTNEGATTTPMLPDNSGSGSAGGVLDLTPSSSYACISQHGIGTGYLVWNNGSSSMTVKDSSGNTLLTVPGKTLYINGSIYVDAPIKISQSMTYKGVGIVMSSGDINFPTNSATICAYNTSCVFTNWQGNTGNNDMLTLASVHKSSSTAINWTGQGITWQGSLWCPTSSTFYLTGQGNPQIQGPFACGSMNINGNSFSFKPLPVIKNMPVGAPVPPNVSAQVGALNIVG